MESKWFWILLAVLFIGGGGLCETEGCLEDERVALLHLKSFFTDPENLLSDWEDVKGSNCCDWERVECSISSKRVIQLSLNYTRPWGERDGYGYLNASLFLPFTELKSLYLNQNDIAGFLDNEGFEQLSRLRNLETLDLSNNRLNNSFLFHVAALSSLKTLNLLCNELEGSLNTKDSLVMTNLEELDLSGNLLNNNSFAFISGLSNLKTLSIMGNNLQGSIDIKELNKLGKLKNLDMHHNQIESLQSFEDSEKQLKLMELERLDLSANLLDNSILGVVSGLSNLKYLNLQWNQLKGGSTDIKDGSNLNHNILDSIGALTSLRNLTLSDNLLTGSLPAKGWCDLRNLVELKLRENAIEGSIPPCFNNLTSLRVLDFSKNHIEVLPSFESLTNNSRLKFLFMDQNRLVTEPTFQTQTENPKLQLKVLTMSNCITKGLPKQLPNFLRYQYELRSLDLSNSNFGGENPSWLMENNTRLKQFLMAGNSFNGSLRLPKHANVNIFQVDMSQNKMQGPIPMNICSTFPNLELLFLSRNAFHGNIPPCLGCLKSLSSLDLSFNNFSGGTILEELGKSSSLGILRLSNNNLSGKIPATVFNSSTLGELYLDGNNFDGEIPQVDISVVSSSALVVIDLSNNHFSGKIPRWIWNLSNLDSLVLSNNHFDDDRIPFELCNLDRLRFLDLSQNNLFGSVPSCFSSLTTVEHLYLSKNKLSGPLPPALYNSSSLVSLDLSHNNLIGKIPNWISTLSILSILILKANHFEGEIPSQVCRLNSLSIIDLSQNKLFGQIPSCLSNLTFEPSEDKSFQTSGGYAIIAFGDFDLGLGSEHYYPANYVVEQVVFTTKKGSYTYSGNILDYMSGIDLSCNMLSGHIPPELGNLSELHSLNLSHNELVGFIPLMFSNLKQVESLDISHNKLSGRIPIQLMELNSLAVFNASYNNLSGSIPHEKAQFATFDESSYLGNPFLCGPPKNESCCRTNSTTSVPNASDDEEESGFLDKHVFYATFVVSYTIVLMTIGVVLYINPYWRQAWLYFIQQCINSSYYFIVDNVLGLFIFRKRF